MKIITQEALNAWLDRLAADYELIAPRTLDGLVLYQPVSSSADITFSYTRPKLSAKDVVFPPTERMVQIEKTDQHVTVAEVEVRKRLVFGLRPCDAHGLAVLDAVFLKEPPDASYARQREAATLIGLACPQMWDGCFCTRMGGAPDDASHLDILLTAVENGYAVNAVTDKGRALVEGLALQEREGSPPRPAIVEGEPPLPPEQWPALFNDRYWDLLAERCIGCRICAYVCPTCRCFDVRDELAERRTRYARYDRLRAWDSCTGANYRVTAGGHNPRPTKGARLRNRFFCKFYYMHQDYDTSGCVGCGRCIEACPVNIDIVEMLQDVKRKT
ncbi:MAG: 4Fe-4S dicluster domain-containing protein [Thermoflexales bacterium]|nr:4Fe-4S dicluster domain-containing protein [Thermoflexales bacterium]